MHSVVIAIGLVAFGQASTSSPERTAVMAAVHQFVDAFNKGDTKTAATACANETSIRNLGRNPQRASSDPYSA
jgi:hypothetical protein